MIVVPFYEDEEDFQSAAETVEGRLLLHAPIHGGHNR